MVINCTWLWWLTVYLTVVINCVPDCGQGAAAAAGGADQGPGQDPGGVRHAAQQAQVPLQKQVGEWQAQ